MVSEWRSVIAVSLNVGGGVRLIKPAKLCMCTQTLQTQRGRTHGAGCVRQWFRTAEPLGERRYENWNTHTHTRLPPHIQSFLNLYMHLTYVSTEFVIRQCTQTVNALTLKDETSTLKRGAGLTRVATYHPFQNSLTFP